jgi:hypothetical protein
MKPVRPASRCCARRYSGCCMQCSSAFQPTALWQPQLGPIAEDYRLSDRNIMGANTLSVALVVDNILNGFARHSSADCRPDRTREDNSAGIHFGGSKLLVAGGSRAQSTVIRDVRGSHLLHVGGDTLPVLLYLHRYVWTAISHCQCRPPLHREGHCGFPRAGGKYGQISNWELGRLFLVVAATNVIALFGIVRTATNAGGPPRESADRRALPALG